MSRYCPNCGHELGSDVRCPNCGRSLTSEPVPKMQMPPDSGQQTTVPPVSAQEKKMPGWLKWLMFGAALAAITAGMILVLVGLIQTIRQGREKGGTDGSPDGTAEETAEPYAVREEVEEYGRITDEQSAKKAAMLSEDEALQEFRRRGFSANPIKVYYSEDGRFTGGQEIESGGKEKHPFYETYYETPDEVVWTVTLMGDTFYAAPMNWYTEKDWSIPHVISESEQFITYDGDRHVFYTMKPDENRLIVKHIDRIDDETLNGLDEWEVDEL